MSIYEFLPEYKTVDGHVVHRIRAVETLIDRGIAAGDVGGWIEKTQNVVERGWVGEDAVVYGDAVVSGDAQVRHRAVVCGAAVLRDQAMVYDDARIDGAAVRDQSTVGGDAVVGAGCVLHLDTHLRTGVWPVLSPAG